eukprot:4183160-Pleurochrysis_carterae.AAC.1
MKAVKGQNLQDDELGSVKLLGNGDEPDTFLAYVDFTGEQRIRMATGFSVVEDDDDNDDDEEEISYPITSGVCRWEYRGDGMAEAYKELHEDEAKEIMKSQQAVVGTILVDDCFGRVELCSQPGGCDLMVKVLETGEDRMWTAWHLFVEDPNEQLLEPEPVIDGNDCTAGATGDSADSQQAGQAAEEGTMPTDTVPTDTVADAGETTASNDGGTRTADEAQSKEAAAAAQEQTRICSGS